VGEVLTAVTVMFYEEDSGFYDDFEQLCAELQATTEYV
jgi:hypothetical protein